MLGQRMSLEEIAEKLNEEKIPTIHGTTDGQLHLFGRHSCPRRDLEGRSLGGLRHARGHRRRLGRQWDRVHVLRPAPGVASAVHRDNFIRAGEAAGERSGGEALAR
jgi:hypothetical protein